MTTAKQEQKCYYYPSGQLYAKLEFKEGKKEGLQEYFYENGQLKTRFTFKNQKLDGQVEFFWSDGREKRTCFLIEGVHEGEDNSYNDLGGLIDSRRYEAGLYHGNQVRFFASGSILSFSEFDHGEALSHVEMNVNGDVIRQWKKSEEKAQAL